jgi:hypothetical protein
MSPVCPSWHGCTSEAGTTLQSSDRFDVFRRLLVTGDGQSRLGDDLALVPGTVVTLAGD